MKISAKKQYNPCFDAQLISQWKCQSAKGKTRQVSIVSLEKQDLSFIQNLSKNLSIYSHLEQARTTIIKSSINMIKDILENMSELFEKTKMLVAIQDGNLCGFLLANIPKEDPNTDRIVYSSRHNPAKNETEVDWLVTWNPQKNEKIRGIGKALMGEYFRTVKADKFRDVYVRAEVPECSYAIDFYESLGFEKISKKRSKLVNKNTALYVIADDSDKNDSIVPMVVTRSRLIKKSTDLAEEMCRQEFVKKSVNLENLLG